jgi:hypothetical protein
MREKRSPVSAKVYLSGERAAAPALVRTATGLIILLNPPNQ